MILSLPFRPFGFAAFTCWPFVFVHKDSLNDSPLLAHEGVHYAEQRRVLTLPWLLAYLLWAPFRLRAEVRAYALQIKLGGLSPEQAAQLLLRYRCGVTYDEVLGLVQAAAG